MHITASVSGIIFGGVFFSLFLFKMYGVIKDFLLPVVYNYMKIQQDEQTEFLERESLLASTKKRIENQIAQQKMHFLVLEKNLQHYFLVMDKKHQMYDEVLQKTNEFIKKKRALQRQHLEETLILKSMIPDLIRNAKNQLIDTYKGNPQGQEWLSAYIKKL